MTIKKLGVIGFLMMLVLSLAAPAAAQAPQMRESYCNQRHSDVATVSLDSDAIDDAFNDLESLGYNPRIVVVNTMTSLGEPADSEADESLLRNESRAFANAIIERCPALQNNGIKAPGLILMLVSIEERYTYFEWGQDLNEWMGTFDDPKLDDYLSASGSEFRRGNFNAGIGAAFREIHADITYESFWSKIPWGSVLQVMLFLILVGLVAWGLTRFVMNLIYRKRHRQHVRDIASEINSRFVDLDRRLSPTNLAEDGNLAFAIETLGGRASADDINPLKSAHEALLERLNATDILGLAALQANTESEPFDNKAWAKFDLGTMDRMDALKALEADTDTLAEQIAELERLVDRGDSRMAALHSARDKWLSSYEAAWSKGYTTPLKDEERGPIEDEFAVASQAFADRQFTLGNKLADAVHDRMSTATAELESLPQWHSDLTQEHLECVERASAVPGSLAEARLTIERLDAEFNPATFRTVIGNGSSAEALLGDINANLPQALDLIEAKQDRSFEQADELIEAVRHKLGEIDSLLRAINGLYSNLVETRDAIAATLERVRRELDSALTYADEKRNELAAADSGVLAELQVMRQRFQQIERGLGDTRPHYLDLSKELSAIDSELDALTAKVREESERVASARERIASLRKTVQTRLDRADDYIDQHRRHVDDSTRAAWDRASARYSETSRRSDSDGLSLAEMLVIIQTLKGIENDATSVQSSAERDYREATRPEPSYSSSSSSSSSNSSSDWGFSGGGGGSSFGDFGGGGGGSFGDSGGGGGGSW